MENVFSREGLFAYIGTKYFIILTVLMNSIRRFKFKRVYLKKMCINTFLFVIFSLRGGCL